MAYSSESPSERTVLLPGSNAEGLDYRASATRERRQTRLALGVLAVGVLLGAFVQSFDLAFLVTNYNRRIASDLNSLGNAAWIVLAGSVAESASQPFYSHVALSKGIEQPLLAAVWICVHGLLLCSLTVFSDALWKLVLSRIVVGFGKSGFGFLTVIIISELVTVTDLALLQSVVTTVGTVGDMMGGPLGSSIASKVGWRSTFKLEFAGMLIACMAITLSLGFGRYAKIKVLPPTSKVRHREFDFYGAICLVTAVVVPLLAIGIGGELLPWDHPLEIAMICISPVFLWLFGWVESRAKSPIIPMRFLADPDALKVIGAAAGVVFAYNSVIFNLSLYIDLQKASFIQDWALTFVFATRPAGAFLAGVVIKRTGRFKRAFLANLVCLGALYVMLSFTSLQTSGIIYIILLVSIGLMIGAAESLIIVALFSVVEKQDRSPLYATFDLILAFSADIAIAVSSAFMRGVVKFRLYEDLGKSEATDEIIKKSLESLDYVRSLPESTRSTVFEALAYSIRLDYVLAAVLVLCSFAVAIRMRDIQGPETLAESEEDHALSDPI